MATQGLIGLTTVDYSLDSGEEGIKTIAKVGFWLRAGWRVNEDRLTNQNTTTDWRQELASRLPKSTADHGCSALLPVIRSRGAFIP